MNLARRRGHRFRIGPHRELFTAVTIPTETAASERVLVVDDEPDITSLVAYHLAKAGYRVATAANGTEALQAAVDTSPDLIVLDLMLPG